MINRRRIVELLLAAWLLAAVPPALASDDDGGGSSGSGGGNSGPGSNNSGPGNNNDDDEADDYSGYDQARARDARKSGNATSLRKIIARVKSRYPGDIVSVNLRGKGSNLSYRIKIIDESNHLITLRVDARTGEIAKLGGS